MFVSQNQAVAVATALAKKFSSIEGRPQDSRTAIPTATINDGGNAAYRFVCDQEAARRARITTAPSDAAADVDARTKDVADAKKAIGAANDDKLSLVDARLTLAVAEASLVFAQAQATAADAVARADSEAMASELITIEAQAAAEAARLAVDAVQADQKAKVDMVNAEQGDKIAQARKKHQEDYHAVKRAEILKAADAV